MSTFCAYFNPVRPAISPSLTIDYPCIVDEFPSGDGCHLCGMPRSEMAAHDHVEGACNQRTISCPLCAKTFTLWSHYEAHKKCHQKLKQRQYPCQSCGKVIYHTYFHTTINNFWTDILADQ